MKDTARVLGRMYDAIEYRGYGQAIVEELAKWAGVPVYNGLTDEFHPTQILADLLTMREHSDKPLGQISYAYLGDARNNMGNTLMLAGALMGMDVRLGAPKHLWPVDELVAKANALAAASGGKVTLTEDPKAAVRGRRLRPHGRLGLDGRARLGLGRADQAPPAVPGQRRAHGRDRRTRRRSSSTASRRSTTARRRSARRSSRSSGSRRWRSPTTSSSRRRRSSSTRPRTASTRSRPSSSRRSRARGRRCASSSPWAGTPS